MEDFRAASLPLSIRNDSSISVKFAGATQWLRSHSVIIQPLTRCLPKNSLVYAMPIRLCLMQDEQGQRQYAGDDPNDAPDNASLFAQLLDTDGIGYARLSPEMTD